MALKIKNADFTSWVTDGHLQTWGTSTISPVSRRILIPYNSNVKPLIYTTVHLKLATMIEYLGYIPDYIATIITSVVGLFWLSKQFEDLEYETFMLQ
ncbi:hypothetical protein [Pseudoalteromonas distincta]|uniref:hypothetical protein n=1 Tax=Pseudoalteromonas distincta TaxID=77608 RepID=UPI0039ECCD1F